MSVYVAADISGCGRYRYTLRREWGPGPRVLWVMLNPSTADATQDDPTIRRCIGFSKREGFGALTVVNLYAIRTPEPKLLPKAQDAVGPRNWDAWCAELAHGFGSEPSLVIAAWGASVEHGPRWRSRVGDAHYLLSGGHDVRCLGRSKDGHPRHPLMLRKDTPLVPWRGYDLRRLAR